MPGRRCNKITWSLAPIIAILAMVLSSGSQSDLQYDSIVTYPTGDYLSWSTGNDIPWTIDFEDGYNDKSSLKSSPIECAGASRLMMDIPGPAIIRFKWKTDSPSGIGQLLFKVDSNKTFECQSRDWTEFSYPLSAGATHELEWCYRKIKSYPQWSGTGWIDNVTAIQMGQYANTKLSRINKSSGNELKNGDYIKINGSPDFQERNISAIVPSAAQTPNITIVIENLAFAPKNIVCTPSKNITVEPLSPKDYEVFAENSSIKFEYRPASNQILKNCSLFIDGNKSNCVRDISSNETNEIYHKERLAETGPYNWNVKCCECDFGFCNSTKEMHFRISKKNITTYVDKDHPDEARFRYKNISYAIARTKEGGQIYIYPGNYSEQLTINKPLSIIGVNWPSIKPILSECTDNNISKVITIASDNVSISGIEIKDGCYGIYVKNNTILRNILICLNKIKDFDKGIVAENCQNCNIIGNIIYAHRAGIYLDNCDECNTSLNRINDGTSPREEHITASIFTTELKNNTFKANFLGNSQNGMVMEIKPEGINETGIQTMMISNGNNFTNCDDPISLEENIGL